MALLPQVFDDSTNSILLTTAVAWPVGSIFISTLSSNPAGILRYGTWAAFGQGRVLVGFASGDPDFGTGGQTGGEKEHTLTEVEMPEHTHKELSVKTSGDGSSGSRGADVESDNTVNQVSLTGGGQPHNNLQPYIVVFMWLRTA